MLGGQLMSKHCTLCEMRYITTQNQPTLQIQQIRHFKNNRNCKVNQNCKNKTKNTKQSVEVKNVFHVTSTKIKT